MPTPSLPHLRALLAALALLATSACGRAAVLGLEVPEAGVITPNDANGLPDITILPDASPPDGTVSIDGGPSPDAGFIEDAMPEDDGSVPDGNVVLDATLPDASPLDSGLDAGAPDALPADTGVIPDAGAPQCMVDQDCSGFDRCDPASFTCVRCFQDSHCPGSQVCDLVSHECARPCVNGQCGPFGICDPNTSTCVECLSNSDCNQNEVCNPVTRECGECAVDADCALVPGRHRCDANAGECVGCVDDAQCPMGQICFPDQGRVCAPATGRAACTPCDADSQCGGANDLCIGYISGGGAFQDRSCSNACSPNSPCPSGFECISVRQNSANVCRPRYDMQTPTCTALRHLGQACLYSPNITDPGCGVTGFQDAQCIPFATTGAVCTIWCSGSGQCPAGTTCTPVGNQGMCL